MLRFENVRCWLGGKIGISEPNTPGIPAQFSVGLLFQRMVGRV